MKLRCRLLALAGLSFFFLALPGAATAAVSPEPVPGGPAWEGNQFVTADRAGNVFFLRANTLEVYPLTRSGPLGNPRKLETASGIGGEILDAALSPDGSAWLTLGVRAVRMFEDGKERPVPPLAWKPFSVGFLRGTPLVALGAVPLATTRSAEVEAIPWVQELGHDAWKTLMDREVVTFAELVRKENWFGEVLESDPVSLLGDRQGKLWVANRYAYRVRRFSPGGRLLLEIALDGGRIRKKQESQGVEVKWADPQRNPTRNPTEATHTPSQEKATFFPFTATEVVQDLVEGRDGRMYFLVVVSNGQAALDRYDPVRLVLERLPLQEKSSGRSTLAAGRSGLFAAPWDGRQARWMISWETLEQASWKEVEGAKLDGVEAEPPGTPTP